MIKEQNGMEARRGIPALYMRGWHPVRDPVWLFDPGRVVVLCGVVLWIIAPWVIGTAAGTICFSCLAAVTVLAFGIRVIDQLFNMSAARVLDKELAGQVSRIGLIGTPRELLRTWRMGRCSFGARCVFRCGPSALQIRVLLSIVAAVPLIIVVWLSQPIEAVASAVGGSAATVVLEAMMRHRRIVVEGDSIIIREWSGGSLDTVERIIPLEKAAVTCDFHRSEMLIETEDRKEVVDLSTLNCPHRMAACLVQRIGMVGVGDAESVIQGA